MFWILAGFEGGLALLGLTLAWILELPPPEIVPRDGVSVVAVTAPLLLFYLLFEKIPLRSFQRIQEFLEDVVVPLFRPHKHWKVWLVALLAGLGEEILFRGVLQALLLDWGWPPWGAIGLTGVAFGLAHSITPLYALIATAMGWYLGWVTWWTDDLGVAIAAHAIYDGFALTRLMAQKNRKI